MRCFPPSLPVELCGNATPGSAFLILTRISPDTKKVRFATLNVPLDVVRDWECFFLDFHAHPGVEVASPPQLSDGLGEPDRTGQSKLDVRQILARGSRPVCKDRGDRVSIGGMAVIYLRGRIKV